MKKYGLALATGFALFAMFFGSGNLVFPLLVGQHSEGHYVSASLGILTTGVFVPFLGVWGLLLYEGRTKDFFSCFGEWGTRLFSLFALALMGPFGVMARCLTVAHGAVQLLIPEVPLSLASASFCVLIYYLARHPGRIVPLLGTVLTPFLLLSVAVIAFFGLREGGLPPVTLPSVWEPFKRGFFEGYQTMDLLAAFFFSQFVIGHLRKRLLERGEGSLGRTFGIAACVGAGILSAVYAALVVLGWSYAEQLVGVPPQELLGTIALHSLGESAGLWVCLAVIFACLTTAIVLVSLFADFLHTELSQRRLGRTPALLLTLAIGFSVSTLDFGGIAAFLGPVLTTIYPALIALTLWNIASKYRGHALTHWPFTSLLILKLLWI